MNVGIAESFTRALLAGEPRSSQDWRAYFKAFHASTGSAGRRHMMQLRDADGLTTYERLVSFVPKEARTLLDVGSGSGSLVPSLRMLLPDTHYTGLDICVEESESAKHDFGSPSTEFVTGDAAEIPFANATFDCVVSHLALMLAEPVDEALAEIHRVLSPGGTFVFLIEDRAAIQNDRFAGIAAAFLRERFPGMSVPVTNPAVRTKEALVDQLRAAGFSSVHFQECEFSADFSAEGLATLLLSFYIYGSLDKSAAHDLREMLVDAARSSADAAGNARFVMPLTLFRGISQGAQHPSKRTE